MVHVNSKKLIGLVTVVALMFLYPSSVRGQAESDLVGDLLNEWLADMQLATNPGDPNSSAINAVIATDDTETVQRVFDFMIGVLDDPPEYKWDRSSAARFAARAETRLAGPTTAQVSQRLRALGQEVGGLTYLAQALPAASDRVQRRIVGWATSLVAQADAEEAEDWVNVLMGAGDAGAEALQGLLDRNELQGNRAVHFARNYLARRGGGGP